ncbi:EamA family transporter, partial [Candidatus Woesearchaeota archaeon]|nr:EamA family transporter [Candidatus Woesearchaeota archaeon]
IIKKKLLDHIEPIQFIIVFYSAMFLFAQTTIQYIHIPSLFEFILIIGACICYIGANLLGLKALKEMRISVFKPISGLTSIFVLFFAIFFLHESISLIQGLGIILVILPITYLAILEYQHKEVSKKSLLYLLLAMIFEAGAIIFDRIILKTLNTFTYFYFLKLILIIMLVVIMYLFYNCKFNFDFFKKQGLGISILALITMLGTYAYFYALSDPFANTGIIKTILSTSLIFTTLIGGFYFKEKHILIKVGIATISLLGIILLIIY